MAEENQQSQDHEQNQLQPTAPPVTSNEGDKKIDSESGNNDPAKKGRPALELPQPFIIKVEKEKKKLISTQQIISIVALLISIYAVTLNKCSLDNSTRAFKITDSTFKNSIRKDSMTSIFNRLRDSLDSIRREQDYMRDTTNINLAKQSLQTQVNSIKETQKEFELESRALLEIGGVTIDSTNLPDIFIIKFWVRDMGKFPALITNRRFGLGMDTTRNIDAVERRYLTDANAPVKTVNETVSSVSHVDYEQRSIKIDSAIRKLYYRDYFHLYFLGEIKYTSLGINKNFSLKFIFRITSKPMIKYFDVESVRYSDKKM